MPFIGNVSDVMLMTLRLCRRGLIKDEGLSKSPAVATPCTLGQGMLSHKPLFTNADNWHAN